MSFFFWKDGHLPKLEQKGDGMKEKKAGAGVPKVRMGEGL